MNQSNSKVTYKDAGVDIEKGDAFVERIKEKVLSTYDDRVYQGVGGFASLYEKGDSYLAAGTDGVGTKLKLAIEINKHDTIGIDLVAMCVNDILCVGANPLFFMDYLACSSLDVEKSEQIINGVVDGCKQSEAVLIGGETAEMPGMYQGDDYDLAGFAVGEVKKENLLDGGKVKSDDALIGLYSSGFHSNGYSLIRKLVNEDEIDLKRMLLEPTKIYHNQVKGLLESGLIHGMAHITGGGLKNIPRINNEFSYQIDKLPLISELPKAMQVILNRLDIPVEELYETFNMGIGLVLITNKPEDVLESLGDDAYLMGKVIDKQSSSVIVNTSECQFEF